MNWYLQNSIELGTKHQKLLRHIGVRNVKKMLALEEVYCRHTSSFSHTLVQIKLEVLWNVTLCHWASSFDSLTNYGAFSLGSKKNTGRKIGWLNIILWLLNSEDEGNVVLWNVDNYLINKTVSHPRRTEPLTTPNSEPQPSPSTDIQPEYNGMCPFCYPEHSVWEVISLNIQIKFTKSCKL